MGGGWHNANDLVELRQCSLDGLHNPVGIRKNIIVPKSDDPEPLLFQIKGPFLISVGPNRVLPAIDLDDQLLREANEIHNIAPHRVLPAKPVSVHLLVPQARPQPLFSIGWILAEASSRFRNHEPIPPTLTLPHKRGGDATAPLWVRPVNPQTSCRIPWPVKSSAK